VVTGQDSNMLPSDNAQAPSKDDAATIVTRNMRNFATSSHQRKYKDLLPMYSKVNRG